MDRSLAALVTCHRETEVQSALTWFVVVAVLITRSAASAESPELVKEDLTDQSGRIMSMELNGRFSTLYEPSGIVALSDGRSLVVENEPEGTAHDQKQQFCVVSSQLWRLSVNGREPAVRSEIGEQMEMLDSTEGLASIDPGQSLGSGVLFVRDNSNEKKVKK